MAVGLIQATLSEIETGRLQSLRNIFELGKKVIDRNVSILFIVTKTTQNY